MQGCRGGAPDQACAPARSNHWQRSPPAPSRSHQAATLTWQARKVQQADRQLAHAAAAAAQRLQRRHQLRLVADLARHAPPAPGWSPRDQVDGQHAVVAATCAAAAAVAAAASCCRRRRVGRAACQAKRVQHEAAEAGKQSGGQRAAAGLVQVRKQQAGVARRHKGGVLEQRGALQCRRRRRGMRQGTHEGRAPPCNLPPTDSAVQHAVLAVLFS